MEVKIGVLHTPRELVLDSNQTTDEVVKAVSKALDGETGVLTLADKTGRQIIVPVTKIAYVEVAEHTQRPVGFTVS